MEPIHAAARLGDLEEVRRLVEDDPQVVHSLYEGYTPLSLASSYNHVQVVALLLDHGANINHQNPSSGQTALYVACSMRRLPVVELLLERGANPAIPTAYNWTPLVIASLFGDVNVVRCLLNHHHHYRIMSTTSSNALHDDVDRALWYACHEGHVEIVRMLLLETGADPLSKSQGLSPMHKAKREGHQECVKVLEEWERSYLLVKARLLYDSCQHHHVASPPQDDDHDDDDGRAKKRVRVEGAAVPTYVKGRVEKGQELPKVEMLVRGREEKVSVGGVLEHVLCGGLKGELFVELMWMVGRVGVKGED